MSGKTASKLALEAGLCYNVEVTKYVFGPRDAVNIRGRDARLRRSYMSNSLPQNTPQDNLAYTKHCKRCDKWLPFSNFYSCKKNRDGLRSWCKKCVNEGTTRATPDRQRGYMLRFEYGITIQEYNHMLIEQGNVCYICKQPETRIEPKTGRTKTLSVDHNHVTGKVRKLLCYRCNLVLGQMQDSPELFRAAADYLDEMVSYEPPAKIVQRELFEED